MGRRVMASVALCDASHQHDGRSEMALIQNRFQLSWCRHPFGVALLAVAVAMGALGGCANGTGPSSGGGVSPQAQADNPAQVRAEEYQRIVAELRRASECVTRTEAMPAFAPLRARAPETGKDDPYPASLLDRSKATPVEQQLIGSLLMQIAPCEPYFGTLSVRVHQTITRMISSTWQQQNELYRHLKEGVITWGIFNQGTRSNADQLSGGLQALRFSDEG